MTKSIGTESTGATRPDASGRSVHRALDIFEALLEGEGVFGVSEIADRAGLPIASAHRVMQTLVRRGYLRKLPDRRYCLGSRLVPLGSAATERMGGRALPLLRGLARELGETVNLAILSAAEAEYLAQAQGTHSMRMFTEVGHRVPLHCTGVGKAMLASMPRSAATRLLTESGMPGFTRSTITTMDGMLKELDEIRRRGYAMDEGEMEDGVRCIAIALPTTSLMAISVSGLTSRMTEDMIERCRGRLLDSCDALLAALR